MKTYILKTISSIFGKRKARGFEKISFKQWVKDGRIEDWRNIALPTRATRRSAAYDIFSTREIYLEPGEEVLMPLGIKIYMQPDEGFFIIPRSGMGFKFYVRLANTVGLIDSDYYNNENNEGHCWIKLRNEGKLILHVEKGKAIAQGSFMKILLADDDNFSKGTERKGGLGSTG